MKNTKTELSDPMKSSIMSKITDRAGLNTKYYNTYFLHL